MKILMTGGAGFIGYYLTKQLRQMGHDVVVYDAFMNFTDPAKSLYYKYLKMRLDYLSGNATIVRGDIRNKAQLMETFREHRPDAVVHLAALAIAPVSNRQPEDAISINIGGTANVIDCIRAFDCVKRMVYASSSFVYGDFVRDAAKETDPTNPVDIYGATKLCGEMLVRAAARQYGMKYTIIRPSAVYGPMDANNRVTQLFAENAALGKLLVLHDSGKARIDFTYVEDTAMGFALALESPKAENETFNITRGQSRSLNELAGILKQLEPGLKIEYKTSTAVTPKRGTLDISKARQLLGYEPRYSLEEGMKSYFDFVKETVR